MNIFEAMKKAVTQYLGLEWEFFKGRLVGLGCDGASVMLGCKSGLITLLQREQPVIVPIHCYGHRLELAFKDSTKKVKLYGKLASLLLGLYYFYHQSALNRSMLKRAYDAY